MPSTYRLTGGSPWGFRLVGGKEFRTDLSVSKVTPGGKAEKAGITPGLVLLEINGVPTKELTHLEAQNKIKSAGMSLNLLVDSAGAKQPSSTPQTGYTSAPKPASTLPQTGYTSAPPKPTPQSGYSSASKPVPQSGYSSAPKPAKSQDFVQSTPSYQTTPSRSERPSYTPVSKPTSIADLKLSDEPLPPPPPSLLSVDIEQPSSGPDPICEGCKKVILGPYLSHKGKNWHVDEFVCAARNCRKPLQSVGFVEENGDKYCQDCYEKHFAHSCGKCHRKIVGEVMHALNQTWHMTCFVCNSCNQPFTDGVFQMQNDKAYCVDCYNRLFSQICKGCNFSIDPGDRYLEAISAAWHETCFNCAVCHIDLKNQGFFAASGKPVCSNHKNARIA